MKPLLLLVLVSLILSISAQAVSGADFAVITHHAGPGSLSRDDMKNILLGNKTKWDDGGNIKLVVLYGGAAHESVIQSFTSRSADQFGKYWKKMVFTGKGTAPEVFKTEDELVAYVAKTPGSIGYVSVGVTMSGVTVIKID